MISEQSSILETEPMGYVNQPKFLNMVIEFETELSPEELLHFCHEIEYQLKRVRTIPNGPRTIDLDILLYGNEVIKTAELIIPHPRLHLREFTLNPLVEIAPNLRHPLLKKSMTQLRLGLQK